MCEQSLEVEDVKNKQSHGEEAKKRGKSGRRRNQCEQQDSASHTHAVQNPVPEQKGKNIKTKE